MNRVELIGRLVSDLELRYTPSGLAIGKINIAVDRQYTKDKRESNLQEQKPVADFPRILFTGKVAEFTSKYLKKGDLVSIEGSIRTGSYENAEGQKVYTTEISCDRIQSLNNMRKNTITEDKIESPYNADSFEIENIPF